MKAQAGLSADSDAPGWTYSPEVTLITPDMVARRQTEMEELATFRPYVQSHVYVQTLCTITRLR